MLKPLMDKNDSFIVTEKTSYSPIKENRKIYFLKQVNQHEKSFIPNMIVNFIRTLRIFIKEKPDVVISTGALATIPMCLISKVFRKKLIFIESFAENNVSNINWKINI